MRAALAALALVVLAAAAAGCGDGGESRVERADLRRCLADGGFEIAPAGAAPAEAGLGSVSPDFRAYLPGGESVAVVVEPSTARAERAAADVRGALSTLAPDGVADRVIAGHNVVLVFGAPPSGAQRKAASACLD